MGSIAASSVQSREVAKADKAVERLPWIQPWRLMRSSSTDTLSRLWRGRIDEMTHALPETVQIIVMVEVLVP